MTELTARVPDGAWYRLTDHYGEAVHDWLAHAEDTLTATASTHGIALAGFYDAGWTSVVAAGQYLSGEEVALKAFPQMERYELERAALAHWSGRGACQLYLSDDASRMLVTELVGGRPGGAGVPCDHQQRVAGALPLLHEQPAPDGTPIPLLSDYYRETVLPRVARRSRHGACAVEPEMACRARSLIDELTRDVSSAQVVLHSDLYGENVVFTERGRPIAIDPHPKIGSPAFDWAFWCVYYRFDGQFTERFELCRSIVPHLADEVLAWSLTVAVDGALYYAETRDSNEGVLAEILSSPKFSALTA